MEAIGTLGVILLGLGLCFVWISSFAMSDPGIYIGIAIATLGLLLAAGGYGIAHLLGAAI